MVHSENKILFSNKKEMNSQPMKRNEGKLNAVKNANLKCLHARENN